MATPVQKSLIVENEKYASAFGEVSGKLPLPPAKNYLIGRSNALPVAVRVRRQSHSA